MHELSELPTRIRLSRATRRWYEREFSNLITIERGSKVAYPNVAIDVCLNEGGNIAAGSDGVHVYLDNDKRRLAPCLKEVARRTPTIRSTKGWGFIVLLENGQIRDDILARIIDVNASRYLADVEDLEQAKKDMEYWEWLGF